MSILTIIATLLIFGFLITTHELGHFIAARKCGVIVEEFAIGMGPSIVRWVGKKDNTKYAIRLLPIGGFCQMKGEDENTRVEGSLNSISPLKRIFVLANGALMNLLTAFIVLILVYSIVGTTPTTTIATVYDNTPAKIAGIENGDTVLFINEKEINSWDDLSKMINDSKGNELTFQVENKAGEERTIKVTPKLEEATSYYKVGISPTYTKDFFSVIKTGATAFFTYIKLTFQAFFDLLRGKIGFDQLAGPIGVASVVENYISAGIATLLNITALLSISIGIFNLIPIPALDGSRIFFCLVENIKGSPISPEKEGKIHYIGFILLMALSLFIAYKDILKLF